MQCPVCLDDDIDERACQLRCGHHLCNRCITQLRQPLCPVCRASIFPQERPPSPPAALDPAYFRHPELMDDEFFLPSPRHHRYWHFTPSRSPRSPQ